MRFAGGPHAAARHMLFGRATTWRKSTACQMLIPIRKRIRRTPPVAPPDVKPGPLPGTPPDINPIPSGSSPGEGHQTGASEPTPPAGAR